MMKELNEVYQQLGPRFIFRKGLNRLELPLCEIGVVDSVCLKYSKKRLKKRMQSENSLEDILETISLWDEIGEYTGFGRYRFLRAVQHREAIQGIAKYVEKHHPQTVVEVGTHLGGSLYVWTRYLEPERIVCVDLSYQEREQFLKEFLPTESTLIKGDSTKSQTATQVDEALNGKSIDFLYIDGSHAYEDVKADFNNFLPIMSSEGIIGFDDLWHDGVSRFWQEIKSEYETEEISDNGLLYL